MRQIQQRLVDATNAAIKRITLQRKIDILTAIGDMTALLNNIEAACDRAADAGQYKGYFRLKELGNFKAVIKKYGSYNTLSTLATILRDELDIDIQVDYEESAFHFTWGRDW